MILIHTLCGIAALLTGLFILFQPKGTLRHVWIGHTYATAMAGLCLTSFAIYELFDGVGPFHVLALVSLATLLAGLIPPLLRDRFAGWFYAHYYFMLYSYVGLVMATGSHFWDVLPIASTWAKAAVLWGLPYLVGAFLIERNKARFFEAFDPDSGQLAAVSGLSQES